MTIFLQAFDLLPETRNRNLLATVDYAFSPEWGIAVTLPIIDREHRHSHNHGVRSYWRLGISLVSGTYACSDDFSEASQIPLSRSAPAELISA